MSNEMPYIPEKGTPTEFISFLNVEKYILFYPLCRCEEFIMKF